MSDAFQKFRKRLEKVEENAEQALKTRQKIRKVLRFRLERGKAVFEKEVLEAHKSIKKSAFQSLADAWIRNLMAAPFIYIVVIPLAILDLFASLYQNVAFRMWRIPRVSRRKFVTIDRHRLAYLNWIQKLNCVYCGYANGVIAYAAEIASKTEQYWCPIKHATRVANSHKRYGEFANYGDAEDFDDLYARQRSQLRKNTDA